MPQENLAITNQNRRTLAGFGGVRQPVRRYAIWAIYGLVFALSGSLAFVLRFELAIPSDYVPHLIAGVGIWVTVKLAAVHLESLDRSRTRFLSAASVARLFWVNVKASIFAGAVIVFLGPPGFPGSIYFIDLAIAFAATIGLRMFISRWDERSAASGSQPDARHALISGAGRASERA